MSNAPVKNNIKLCYIRAKSTNRDPRHRGAPVAIIATDFDVNLAVIRYTVATVHKDDHFIKERARHIALERLDGVDRFGRLKARRDSGPRVLIGDAVKNILSMDIDTGRGHAITKVVMADILECKYLPQVVRNSAKEWLKLADKPRTNTLLPPRRISFQNPVMSETEWESHVRWDTGLTKDEAASFTAPMRHKRWEELNPDKDDLSDKVPTIPVPAMTSYNAGIVARFNEKSDAIPTKIREHVKSFYNEHRDAIPPPPLNEKQEPRHTNAWMAGRTMTDILAIQKAKAEANPNISMEVVVQWYDAAKARGFDGTVRFPDPMLPAGPNVVDDSPASSRASELDNQ